MATESKTHWLIYSHREIQVFDIKSEEVYEQERPAYLQHVFDAYKEGL